MSECAIVSDSRVAATLQNDRTGLLGIGLLSQWKEAQETAAECRHSKDAPVLCSL